MRQEHAEVFFVAQSQADRVDFLWWTRGEIGKDLAVFAKGLAQEVARVGLAAVVDDGDVDVYSDYS
jgi:hypothetical protein